MEELIGRIREGQRGKGRCEDRQSLSDVAVSHRSSGQQAGAGDKERIPHPPRGPPREPALVPVTGM